MVLLVLVAGIVIGGILVDYYKNNKTKIRNKIDNIVSDSVDSGLDKLQSRL